MTSSAAEQLCLDVTPAETPQVVPTVDLVETLLTHHQGDYRAAMAELLLDADFLRDKLYTASCLLSHGMGRGWKPKYERL
jgi:hypothetical protein